MFCTDQAAPQFPTLLPNMISPPIINGHRPCPTRAAGKGPFPLREAPDHSGNGCRLRRQPFARATSHVDAPPPASRGVQAFADRMTCRHPSPRYARRRPQRGRRGGSRLPRTSSVDERPPAPVRAPRRPRSRRVPAPRDARGAGQPPARGPSLSAYRLNLVIGLTANERTAAHQTPATPHQ